MVGEEDIKRTKCTVCSHRRTSMDKHCTGRQPPRHQPEDPNTHKDVHCDRAQLYEKPIRKVHAGLCPCSAPKWQCEYLWCSI